MKPTQIIFFSILLMSCSQKFDEDTKQLTNQQFLIAQQISSFLEKSQLNLNKGNYQSAINHVDSAFNINNNLVYPIFLKGMIYEELNQFNIADSLYKKVLTQIPTFRNAYLNLGNIALARGEYVNAVKYFKLEKENKLTSKVLIKLGIAYANVYEVDSALAVLKEATNIDSMASEAFMLIGKINRDNGDMDNALSFMKKAIEIQPDNWDYQLNFGTLLFKIGDLKNSLKFLENTVRINKWHYASHYNLGQLLLRLDRNEEAEKYLLRADTLQQTNKRIGFFQENLKSNPQNISDWLKMGIALQSIENWNEAYEVFKIVDHLDPDNLDVKQNLAFLAISNQDTISGIKYYQKILSKDNSKSDIWFNLGLMYSYQGKFSAAKKCWIQALEINPNDLTALEYLESLSKLKKLPFYD